MLHGTLYVTERYQGLSFNEFEIVGIFGIDTKMRNCRKCRNDAFPKKRNVGTVGIVGIGRLHARDQTSSKCAFEKSGSPESVILH